MSVLPPGLPLRRYLADLDDLLADPQGYLSAGAVVVGPRQMYRLAALFAVPGLAFLASCYFFGPDGERLAMGIGLLLGAGVWLGWSFLMRGHELVLLPDGVEVNHGDSSVRAPWALFNADGLAHVPASDSPLLGLTLPVNREAVPFVELRRGGLVMAQGAQVQGRQWRFTETDEVVLPARYAVVSEDLSALLLILGRRLGRELPRRA